MHSNQSAVPAIKDVAADQKQPVAVKSKIEAKLDKTLSEHRGKVNALMVLADGRLVSGAEDGIGFSSGGNSVIKLWDVENGRCLQTLYIQRSLHVTALTVLTDGRLTSGSREGTIDLWDVRSGQCVQTLSGHGDGVAALTVLADGRLASGSHDKTIKLWDVKSGQCVQTLRGHSREVYALTVLADGHLTSGSGDGTIKLWNVRNGQCVQTLSEHKSAVRTLTVLSEGQLASGSGDGTIKFWDVERGQCMQTLRGRGAVDVLTVLADGRLVSGNTTVMKVADVMKGYREKATINFWDAKTGQCMQTLSGHSETVNALTVLADGRLASGSEDKTIKLWDVGTKKILQLQAEAQREAREKAEREKQEMQDKLAAQAKELAEMKAQLEQMKIQQQNKPVTGLSVSFEIPYNELQIGEKLGSGGFGVVHKGMWKFQNVAIKELLDEKPSKDAVAEFKREMQIMAELRSNQVVQFKGCVLGNPKYCIVMEYMPKGSLYSVLHGDQPLNWWTRYKIARDVASGLAFLHSSSILHRDLKSLNVLLDEHYRAKLTDFGLSKLKTETRTTTKNQSIGSEGWMAPELDDPDVSYTKNCDVFSMGITFWEVATRKIPYEKIEAGRRSRIISWTAQNKREEIPADCHPKFTHLIKWCWDTDPAKRPTAMEAMKYLQDSENDFKPFDTDQNVAVPVNANAPAAANSFAATVRK